jgi:hypothetical protein
MYLERLDAGAGAGHAFVNGKHFDVNDVCAFSFFLVKRRMLMGCTGFPQADADGDWEADAVLDRAGKPPQQQQHPHLSVIC